MNTKKTLPGNKDKELTPILDELSHNPDKKLDQIKSMIIVCVAFKMFPRHIVEKSIKSLRPYKRQRAIKLVSIVLYYTLSILSSVRIICIFMRLIFDLIPD